MKESKESLAEKFARIEKRREENIRNYGTARPKLADIMSGISLQHESEGEKWNPITSTWEK